jgi:ABC-2 type transport system permease protein
MLLAPIVMMLLAIFTLGIGLFISTIGVYFIDVVEMYAILLMAWMYLTPVIYSLEILSPRVQSILQLNPMVHLVNLFRDIVFYGVLPSSSEWLISLFVSAGSLLLGWLFFTGKVDEFAYRT